MEKKEKNFTHPKSTSIEVTEYVYEKVKKEDIKINIPMEPVFYQQHNHRIIIGLFPQYTNWMPEEHIWEIQIVKITNKSIIRTMIRSAAQELSHLLSINGNKMDDEDALRCEVVDILKNFFTEDRVEEKIFIAKFRAFLENVDIIIKPSNT